MLFNLKKMRLVWMMLGCLLASSICTAEEMSVKAQRLAVDAMAESVLQELYASKPSVKGLVKNAHGYAVFNNDNINVILATSEGYGVAKNIRTGDTTYMFTEDLAGTFAKQDKVFKLVFVFNTADAYDRFVAQDWSNVQAESFSDWLKSASSSDAQAVHLYQFIDSVLVIDPNIANLKFWINEKL